jgi:uncharacterized protein YicC (UPF0701 family)
MNLHSVELRISLIDYFIITVLKRSLPEACQSMDHSAHNEIADEMARGRLSGTIVSDRSHNENRRKSEGLPSPKTKFCDLLEMA